VDFATIFSARGHYQVMRKWLLLLVAACGGNTMVDPDSGAAPDTGVTMKKDSGDPMLSDDGGGDAAPDAPPPGMSTPNGSILALARGPMQNDYLTVVRVEFPSATVTPLWTFQPANGMRPRAIAMRPDGAIDRFDIEGFNTATPKTHVIPVSKQTGMQVGQERVFDGVISGADWSNNLLYAVIGSPMAAEHIVTIDAQNTITTIATKACVEDVGLVTNVAALWVGCGEDVWFDEIFAYTPQGMMLPDIASNISWWDAMTPMGKFLVVVDDYGRLQIIDPATKLWSSILSTSWHYRDATEEL
jgi:hypothetical protein